MSGKKRITITISKNVLKMLDSYCEFYGIKRSDAISKFVAHDLFMKQPIMQYFAGGGKND